MPYNKKKVLLFNCWLNIILLLTTLVFIFKLKFILWADKKIITCQNLKKITEKTIFTIKVIILNFYFKLLYFSYQIKNFIWLVRILNFRILVVGILIVEILDSRNLDCRNLFCQNLSFPNLNFPNLNFWSFNLSGQNLSCRFWIVEI